MPVVVGVALGGALGASARYGLDRAIDHMGDPIPLPYSVQEDLERFLKENPPEKK